MRFQEEARAFGARKKDASARAVERVAVQLICGFELSAALASGGALRERLMRRIARAIERERLKGMRRHWSYDLNRHIALKQALDRLREPEQAQTHPTTADAV